MNFYDLKVKINDECGRYIKRTTSDANMLLLVSGMRFTAQIQSFRARLLLLLALMLGLTLGIQYYFNVRTVRANAR